MTRRINWDAANRQARLRRWIQNNPNYDWFDELPPHTSDELDKWARRQVRISVSRVRKRFEELRVNEDTTAGIVKKHLNDLGNSIEVGDYARAKKLAQEVINIMVKAPLTAVDKELREQILQTLGLFLDAID